MRINFSKYHGSGNDFVIIDNRDHSFIPTQKIVAFLCDRRFGIGADGLMLLEPDKDTDLRMIYYNANGLEGTMCGNGGRCIAGFAGKLGIVEEEAVMKTIDGLHPFRILAFDGSLAQVQIKLNDVPGYIKIHDDYVLDTGSPHFIRFVNDLDNTDVVKEGAEIRYSPDFPKGINVNFVEEEGPESIRVRTYERGVENETLSCGTGVTASAIALSLKSNKVFDEIEVNTRGGNLKVSFRHAGDKFEDIWLTGPAQFVYEGTIEV